MARRRSSGITSLGFNQDQGLCYFLVRQPEFFVLRWCLCGSCLGCAGCAGRRGWCAWSARAGRATQAARGSSLATLSRSCALHVLFIFLVRAHAQFPFFASPLAIVWALVLFALVLVHVLIILSAIFTRFKTHVTMFTTKSRS